MLTSEIIRTFLALPTLAVLTFSLLAAKRYLKGLCVKFR